MKMLHRIYKSGKLVITMISGLNEIKFKSESLFLKNNGSGKQGVKSKYFILLLTRLAV